MHTAIHVTPNRIPGCHGVWGKQAEDEGRTEKKASLSCAGDLGLVSLG